MKICDHCKESKPVEEFWKCKSRPDGLQLRCKKCHNALIKKRRDKLVLEGKIIPAKRYSKEETERAIKMYNDGYPLREIERQMGLTHVALGNRLRKMKVKIRDRTHYDKYIRKAQFKDRNWFDEIDSEEKAYWLGFLYADGCNHRRGKTHKHGCCYLTCISLRERDGYMLNNLNDSLMKDRFSLTNIEKEGNRQNQIRFGVYDKHLSDTLLKWGLKPRKSFTLKWPSFLREDLYRHFLRGYIDGDGTICFTIAHKRKCTTGYVGLISSVDFCRSARDWLSKNGFSAKMTTLKKYTKPMAIIRTTSSYEAIRICDFIYKDAKIYLKRKYYKYIELKKSKEGIKRQTCQNGLS